MALRFAGQQTTVSLIDSTTGEQLMPDLSFSSVSVNFNINLTDKMFLGEAGPQYREFYNGYDFSIKAEPNNAKQYVDFINRIIARSQGLSNDEFAASFKYDSPDNGSFRITLRDLHFDTTGLDTSGQQDFAESEFKGKGQVYKLEVA